MFDTRQEMRNHLRFRLFDTSSTTFTDAQLNTQLNMSAQVITIFLANNSRIRTFARGEVEITPSPGTAVVIDAADFHTPISLQSTNGLWYGSEVDEREFPRALERANKDGEFLFCITYDPTAVDDATPRPYFLKTAYADGQGVGTCTLAYTRRITPLDVSDSGADDDLEMFPTVPYAYREWIVAHAAAMLATQANIGNAQGLLGYWNMLHDTFLKDSRSAVTPSSTR